MADDDDKEHMRGDRHIEAGIDTVRALRQGLDPGRTYASMKNRGKETKNEDSGRGPGAKPLHQ